MGVSEKRGTVVPLNSLANRLLTNLYLFKVSKFCVHFVTAVSSLAQVPVSQCRPLRCQCRPLCRDAQRSKEILGSEMVRDFTLNKDTWLRPSPTMAPEDATEGACQFKADTKWGCWFSHINGRQTSSVISSGSLFCCFFFLMGMSENGVYPL